MTTRKSYLVSSNEDFICSSVPLEVNLVRQMLAWNNRHARVGITDCTQSNIIMLRRTM